MKNREPLHFFQRNLSGIPIYDTKRNDFIYFLKDKIDRGETNIVFGISAAALGRLKFRRDLYGIYQKMDIIIAEGAGLTLFAKSFGVTITEKIGLVNVVYDLLELANKKEYRVLFFGATDEVNKEAQHKIQKWTHSMNDGIKQQLPTLHDVFCTKGCKSIVSKYILVVTVI